MPATAHLAATPGQPPLAQQVNQLLVTHPTTYIYTGVSISSQGTAGSGGTNSNGLWLAQSFTTGAATTAIGRVRLDFSYTGSPGPLALALYANSGGTPSGAALVTTVVPASYLTAAGAVVSIPLPAAVSPSTTYWIVTQAVGDASDCYSWVRSNQTSGASTSSNGSTWTAVSYGFIYNVLDQTATPPLQHMWADSGARWTATAINTGNQITGLQEYTVAQGSAQYMYSPRTLSYSGTSLASVT